MLQNSQSNIGQMSCVQNVESEDAKTQTPARLEIHPVEDIFFVGHV